MARPARYKVGETYGRLTLLAITARGSNIRTMGLYRCVCGTQKEQDVSRVTNGKIVSCGCFHREVTAELLRARNLRHGRTGTRVYATWVAMLQRCTNPKNHKYHDYGGRGITVCKRWLKFENFYADMGDRPAGMSLERINNNRGYSPSNCKWATQKEQQNNRRVCRYVTFKRRTLTVMQWAEATGISHYALYDRFYAGWSVERALTTPPRTYNRRSL